MFTLRKCTKLSGGAGTATDQPAFIKIAKNLTKLTFTENSKTNIKVGK